MRLPKLFSERANQIWKFSTIMVHPRAVIVRTVTFILFFLVVALLPNGKARAQELLSNRSFESPAAPALGNNFYATIPNWTVTNVTPAQTNPFNIIRPHSGYAGNPTATPSGGGTQYVDVNTASGNIRQSITIPSNGMIDFSGYFSVRGTQQALTGLTLNVINSSNVVVATASTSFLATDAIGLWKQASSSNVPITAGTYTFEIVLPDPANFDLASVVFKPAVTVTKSSIAYSDPVNNLTNPKHIPGGVVEYTISATTPSSYAVTNNTLVMTDATPANVALVVADFGSAGSGPAAITAGASTLTYTFTSLSSTTDDIEFSNNGGTSYVYTPVADANGADSAVTHVRLRPKGSMAASATVSFRLRYRIN